MNKVMLMGRFTRDIEIKHTSSDKVYFRNAIAVDSYAGKDKERTTDFIQVVAWENRAETISKYFKKGSQILIEGKLHSRSYDSDGKRVYVTEVNIDNFYFVGVKDSSISNDEKNDNFTDNVFSEPTEDIGMPF